MGLICNIGIHKWEGCKCASCGKTRDKEHKWEEDSEGAQVCEICGQGTEEQHIIDNQNKSAG